MATIRMSEEVWEAVDRHLYSMPGEHFAFLLARFSIGPDGPIFLVHDVSVVPDSRVQLRRDGYQLSLDAIVDVVNAAVRSGDALIEVHNHGGRQPRFSLTDRDELPEFVAYVLESLPGRPYAATVWGDDSIYGEWFASHEETGVIRSVTILGEKLSQRVSRDDDDLKIGVRFDRQLPWFTEAGQQMLGRLRVGIVGAGGTGSQVVQSLTYLGIRDFVLVEPDDADPTNMNRLVTALHADIGTPKGILSRRLIRSVTPAASVELELEGLPSPASIGLLKDVDVIFGCVDNDGSRLVLNALSLAYRIPYFDSAVGIESPDGKVEEAGGRVAVILPGGPCLRCMQQLDLDEARHWLRSDVQQRFAEERGYVSGLRVSAPAVISLNGVVASAAVNEFAMLISGIRAVNPLTDIDLLGRARNVPGQWMTPRRVERNRRCMECLVAGLGDGADLERFWRRGRETVR